MLLSLGVLILIAVVVCGVLSVVERRLLSSLHYRLGPTVNGLYGILCLLTDGLKLLLKSYASSYATWSSLVLGVIAASFAVMCLGYVVIGFYLTGSLGACTAYLSVLGFEVVCIFAAFLTLMLGILAFNPLTLIAVFRVALLILTLDLLLLGVTMLLLQDVLLASWAAITTVSVLHTFLLTAGGLWILLLACLIGVDLSRGSFDVIDAESELVCGYLIEISGAGFAAMSIVEVMHYTMWLVFALVLSLGVGGPVILFFLIIANLARGSNVRLRVLWIFLALLLLLVGYVFGVLWVHAIL